MVSAMPSLNPAGPQDVDVRVADVPHELLNRIEVHVEPLLHVPMISCSCPPRSFTSCTISSRWTTSSSVVAAQDDGHVGADRKILEQGPDRRDAGAPSPVPG